MQGSQELVRENTREVNARKKKRKKVRSELTRSSFGQENNNISLPLKPIVTTTSSSEVEDTPSGHGVTTSSWGGRRKGEPSRPRPTKTFKHKITQRYLPGAS